ncbi:hypothetical protein Tsubulata_042158 [Turnera subulata]|uniref:Histone deacetylase domain-containing protein n=1 Tax=Turnera subulata TaxID=218843 RepID=A0A9Q0F5C4_9ROSI|nr:hypothetical protein Tsubulata_042158 [Turnera subulata]
MAMTSRVAPITTESARYLGKSTLYFFLTIATIKLSRSLFHLIRSRAMSPSSSSFSSSAADADAETLRRNRILSSKLYFDMPPSKAPLIYSPAYDISFLGIEKLHPFDSSKWGRVCRFLAVDGVLDKNSIVEPLEASKDDLLVVHTESYLSSLKNSQNVAMIIEVPPVALFPNCIVQQKVLYPFRKQEELFWQQNLQKSADGPSTLEEGSITVAVEKEGDFVLTLTFLFVYILLLSERVYILDMYNPGIYPFDYEARRYIDQKVEVPSGTTTKEYLNRLDEALEVAGQSFDPELVVYNAGTDILDGDPLGRLKISPDGIASRDEKVFRFAREKNAPLVMLTSGQWLYEVECKGHSRFHSKSLKKIFDKFEQFQLRTALLY